MEKRLVIAGEGTVAQDAGVARSEYSSLSAIQYFVSIQLYRLQCAAKLLLILFINQVFVSLLRCHYFFPNWKKCLIFHNPFVNLIQMQTKKVNDFKNFCKTESFSENCNLN